MSATIVTVTGDKRIQLLNSQLLRRPVYLNNWTTIRIGVHFTWPSAATIVGTPRLYVGVCNGLTNGIGDAVTTNFCGISTNAASITRAVSGAQAYANVGALRVLKKVASTTTYHATGDILGTGHASMDATGAWLAVMLVEITKGSPNYTFTLGMASSNSGVIGVNITPAHMDQYINLPVGMTGIGSVANPNIVASVANNTLAMSEVAGVLDTINIYWDKTAAPCEISGIYHKKVA